MTSKNDNFANQKNPQHPQFYLDRRDPPVVAENKAFQKQIENQEKSAIKRSKK